MPALRQEVLSRFWQICPRHPNPGSCLTAVCPGLQVIVFDKYHEVSSNTSIPLVNTANRDLYILGSGRERVRDLTARFQRKYLENFKLERLILLIVSSIGYSIILITGN